ncbi:uncharacterized protein LOC135436462 [Drosophila montana]|uniref:uncharacterized protein LOC135436462 n=1 Tax=Drosophila montana TaxID=40370 RepID=UPI00313E78E6
MVQTRVIVYLNQNSGEIQTGAAIKKDTFQYGGEVSVSDDKTLRLLCCQNASKPHVLVAQKLRFDMLCAQRNEEHKERELKALLHTLLVDQRDCLLMHLAAERGYHLMFLVDTLIVQINVKLQQESLQLIGCAVRYRHVVEGTSSSSLDTQSNFSDMKHLMSWLLNEYRMRTALATGHEALEVHYVLTREEQGSRFSVKFHILLVAMEEMCLGTLCGLRCYLSNDLLTAALSVTELTTYMRQAAEENTGKSLYMLMLCHVLVTGSQVNCKNVQLLGLAHLATEQRDAIQERVETVHMSPTVVMPTTDALVQLKELELCHQEMNERFQLLHDQLLAYVQHEQQLKRTHCQLLKERTGFVATLLASEAKLVQLRNLLVNNIQN